MKDDFPVLTLVKDPIIDWGLSTEKLIESYYECLTDHRFNFLGYKSNLFDFVTNDPSEINLADCKYFNLYSEISDVHSTSANLYSKFTGKLFTHDLILSVMPNKTLEDFRNKLGDVLSISTNQIKITFIEANITLLSHRDNAYFEQRDVIHPSMNRIKDAMIANSALNWNLIGKESIFRVNAGSKKYTNWGKGELSFFDPCTYKHGTSDNIPRLTLTARFFDIDYTSVWDRINKNLEILEVNPCK